MPVRNSTSHARGDLALLAITLVWGTTFTVVKAALDDSSTLAFLAMRFSLAALALAAIWRRHLVRGWDRASVRAGLGCGACLAAGYVSQTTGLRYTTASKSAFVTSMFVVMVPLLGALVYRNVPSFREWLGVGMAFSGMAMMVQPNSTAHWNQGDLLTLVAAFAYAGQLLLVDRWSRHVSAPVLTLVQVGTVAVVALSTFWWAETVFVRPSGRLLGALGATAILGTAVAFSVQSWAQRHTTATRACLIFSVEPVAAAATSYMVSGERLPALGVAGAALILAGILTVEMKRQTPPAHLVELE
ncbi:MAG: DMT family transporter [Bryobacteraceae bacterium]